MITPHALRLRIRRLDELARGLAQEVALWEEGNDPLLFAERRAYLGAIQDALAGLEEARVTLARASRRLDDLPQNRIPRKGEPGASATGEGKNPPVADAPGSP